MKYIIDIQGWTSYTTILNSFYEWIKSLTFQQHYEIESHIEYHNRLWIRTDSEINNNKHTTDYGLTENWLTSATTNWQVTDNFLTVDWHLTDN